VSITITAAIVAPMARNLRKSVRTLLVLVMLKLFYCRVDHQKNGDFNIQKRK